MGSYYLWVPIISLGVLLGMAYGPTMPSQPLGLTKLCPLLEWNGHMDGLCGRWWMS